MVCHMLWHIIVPVLLHRPKGVPMCALAVSALPFVSPDSIAMKHWYPLANEIVSHAFPTCLCIAAVMRQHLFQTYNIFAAFACKITLQVDSKRDRLGDAVPLT